jgi:DNA-binding CsgD family transcriptional regulator
MAIAISGFTLKQIALALPLRVRRSCVSDTEKAFEPAVKLLDTIYEAAFIPQHWGTALQGLAEASGSVGSAIFVFDSAGPGRGVTLDNLSDLLVEFLSIDTLRFSTSVVRMCEVKPNSFVEVDVYLTAEEIQNDPIRIQLRKRGMGVHVCTAIPMPSGELVVYVLQRPLNGGGYADDAVERLNGYRPHLARAGLMAARLGLERAHNTVAVMQSLGLAAAVCAGNRVLAANALLLSEPETFRIGQRDQLSLTQPAANSLLQEALQSVNANVGTKSFPLPSTEKHGPGVLHLIPLRQSARDLFPGGDTVLVFTPVSATEIVPIPTILSGLFDLSPSESKLAISLTDGKPLRMAAAACDIKFTTARAYLEQIFRKTGTNKQSQLVALLKSANVVRSRQP